MEVGICGLTGWMIIVHSLVDDDDDGSDSDDCLVAFSFCLVRVVFFFCFSFVLFV